MLVLSLLSSIPEVTDMGESIVLFLVLDIFLVSFTVVMSCPYQDPNCKCEQKKVTCYELTKFPQLRNGSDVTAVTEAYFLKTVVGNIPNNSLPPGLTSFVFECISLSDISDDAFQTSANTLEQVSINSVTFRRLPEAICKLTKLTSLIIDGYRIEGWNVTDLQQIGSTLKILILKGVGLTSWPSWLSYFHSLTVLDLSNNALQYIPDDAFISHKDTLTHLTLSLCNLTQIQHALSVLRNLTSLAFHIIKISDVNDMPTGIDKQNAVPCVSTLQVLNVGGTELKIMPDFSNMTTLHNLTVRNFDIELITESLPPGLTDLTLAHNKLTSVPVSVNELSRLTYLDLSYNEITQIDLNQIPPSVITFNLCSNKITNIVGGNSDITSHLQYLFMSLNPISNISSTAFNTCPSLITLDLGGTDLDLLPPALTSLTRLEVLKLSVKFCPQPPPSQLVYWYRSLVLPNTKGVCQNGRGKIADYMRGCQPDSPCDACTLVHGVYCSFCCLLLSMTSYYF